MDTIINFDEAYCDGKLGHKERVQRMHWYTLSLYKNTSLCGLSAFNKENVLNIMIDI